MIEPKSDTINIWLVDDNKTFRKTLINLINQSDSMKAEKEFSSAVEMLIDLKKSNAPDVILLDIGLPDLSGLDAIRKIKVMTQTTNVIMLTVYDDKDKIFRALLSGADGYLLKFVPAKQLVESILEVTSGGAPVSPRVAKKIIEMFSGRSETRADYNLTSREKDILRLLIQGLPKKAIAEQLIVSRHTVDTHFKNIYIKLQVHSKPSAVAKVLSERII
jgi:DNA-binding NarL/FixJ family response regulator